MKPRPDAIETRIAEVMTTARDTIDVPPIDPARERALLAAFDAHHARRRRQSQRWMWTAAAASVVMAAALAWPLRRPSTPAAVPPAPESDSASADAGGFVAWPGADALPRFESGTLVRVDLPVSSLPALGVVVPIGSGDVVPAELVVGQDGFARAVRFLQH